MFLLIKCSNNKGKLSYNCLRFIITLEPKGKIFAMKKDWKDSCVKEAKDI